MDCSQSSLLGRLSKLKLKNGSVQIYKLDAEYGFMVKANRSPWAPPAGNAGDTAEAKR